MLADGYVLDDIARYSPCGGEFYLTKHHKWSRREWKSRPRTSARGRLRWTVGIGL